MDFDSAPYIPILGAVACSMGQVPEAAFVADAQAQATALQQVAAALGADAITVGWHTDPAVTLDVMRRIPSRELVALLETVDPNAARELCEAGAAAIFLSGDAKDLRFKQVGRAAAHYAVPVLLLGDAEFAAAVGLSGAIVPDVRGDEPGIVGGGLPEGGAPSRAERFFWTFPGETPDLPPEELAALRERL